VRASSRAIATTGASFFCNIIIVSEWLNRP
jgi:hypothetical protein